MAITEKYVTSAGAGSGDGSSEANALSWANMVTAINAGGVAGNRYNVKGSISRTTTTDTLTGAGTSTSPVIIRGYATTIGDGYLGRTNGNGPLITTNMPALAYTSGRLVLGQWTILESIDYTTAFNGSGLGAGSNSTMVRCRLNSTSTNGTAAVFGSGNSNLLILDCDVIYDGPSGGTAAINITGHGDVIACRIKGGTAPGITGQGVRSIVKCTIFGCTNGILVASVGAPAIFGNTIVGNSVDGINFVTGSSILGRVINNLISDNAGYGINGVSAANAVLAAYNRLDRNTLGATNLATDWLAATGYSRDITSVTQADEYSNAAGNDYRLVDTSPALGIGVPAYADIGALQKENTGGGGGGTSGISKSRVVNAGN